MTKIQKDMLKKPCPACKRGTLRVVAEEDDDQETVLWCNCCDISVDTSGGYTGGYDLK